jgi:hypothetical protein
MATYLQGTQPDPNPSLTINNGATEIICSYPLASQRKDYNQSEWNTYKIEWTTFNQIWAYNYTVSTLNGQGGSGSDQKKKEPYHFLSYNQRVAYIKGQLAHIAYYIDYLGIAPVGQFNNIVF